MFLGPENGNLFQNKKEVISALRLIMMENSGLYTIYYPIYFVTSNHVLFIFKIFVKK